MDTATAPDQEAAAGWPRAALVSAAQRGDRSSIAALVTDSHPHVRRFARALCASDADAEDAAQEALIILYRRIGTLRATGALASWLFRIVRNECLRHARRAWRGDDLTRVSATLAGEDDLMRRLEELWVAEAIAGLPPDLRRVLVLRDLLGYPGRTVADALGLSVSAMKSRLHRARAAVREHLTGESDEVGTPLATRERLAGESPSTGARAAMRTPQAGAGLGRPRSVVRERLARDAAAGGSIGA
ncbi:RNA polymerase sigma factor [Glycomyces paridis]|uniref:RNA polymerase sigma factor n=1 Tax=Glycomyces paridis TaxID=2126555 RepID=A0A4V4HP26_9ACTN|nr:RNA polymerase sigma factor [Glycomyces paridis]THV28366.1 RNA polymerase sigma factor [Glycomyces paridis]